MCSVWDVFILESALPFWEWGGREGRRQREEPLKPALVFVPSPGPQVCCEIQCRLSGLYPGITRQGNGQASDTSQQPPEHHTPFPSSVPVCHSLVNDSDFPPGEMSASASTSDITSAFVCQVPTACQGPLSTGNSGKPNAITVLSGFVHAATAISHCLTRHHTQHGLQCTASMRSPFLFTNEQAQ